MQPLMSHVYAQHWLLVCQGRQRRRLQGPTNATHQSLAGLLPHTYIHPPPPFPPCAVEGMTALEYLNEVRALFDRLAAPGGGASAMELG